MLRIEVSILILERLRSRYNSAELFALWNSTLRQALYMFMKYEAIYGQILSQRQIESRKSKFQQSKDPGNLEKPSLYISLVRCHSEVSVPLHN